MIEEEKGTPMDTDSGPTGDMVAATLDEVRKELDERRRRGEIPHLPAGELNRQFDAVVEAVDGAVAEMTPVGSDGLAEAAALPAWRPTLEGGTARKAFAVVFWPFLRVFGLLVRRQTGEFARRTAEVVNEVVDRQNRMQRFLARAHLDRVRSLELRVAELERELDRIRADSVSDN